MAEIAELEAAEAAEAEAAAAAAAASASKPAAPKKGGGGKKAGNNTQGSPAEVDLSSLNKKKLVNVIFIGKLASVLLPRCHHLNCRSCRRW